MSYNNALVTDMGGIGDAFTREDNDALYPLVATGDPYARKRMIEGNMSLVISKVEAYIRCFPTSAYLRDDMTSEGFVGLCTAVKKMGEAGLTSDGNDRESNATGYMSHWINRYIGTVVDREVANGASVRTIQRHRANDIPILQPANEPLEPLLDRMVDPMSEVDLRDLIDSCCETDEQRFIVRMREQQYPQCSDREIAEALNMPLTAVYMMRREIYARFLAKSGMKGEV